MLFERTKLSETGDPSIPGFALGLGLTNECNLACSFCYRDPTRIDRLTLDEVRAVMKLLLPRLTRDEMHERR
jgi:MoaA/NifB/PqqE/SkfB family radical SAM enzyme